MVTIATRGLFFLCAAFHAVWALLVYALPSSLARWITQGTLTEVAPYYFYTALLVALASLAAALYAEAFRKVLFVVLLLKLMEMAAAYFGLAGGQFTPRLFFHLMMNGVLWLGILGVALWKVWKSERDMRS
jgi:hypothetical protein